MIVLDTNVVSEAMKPNPNPTVAGWLDEQDIQTLYLSAVSQAELLVGVGALPAGARKDRLHGFVQDLFATFEGRVLPFDQDAARQYAELAVAARIAGRPLPIADAYIAACAASKGFAVATRNTRHFQDTGLKLINPWG